MTEVDEIVIKNFESKLSRLMDAYTQVSEENTLLREQLDRQSAELGKAREQYALLEKSYSDLRLAKIISATDDEIGDTQKRLSKLVREVDKCIALLNASEQKKTCYDTDQPTENKGDYCRDDILSQD